MADASPKSPALPAAKDPLMVLKQMLHSRGKGRPRGVPHRMTTIRMDRRIRQDMIDFCIEEGVTQRAFMEIAAVRLMAQYRMFKHKARLEKIAAIKAKQKVA